LKNLKSILFLITLLVVWPVTELSAKGNIAGPEIAHKADALMQQFFEDNNTPGLSVSVGLGGKLVWSQGYGYADLEQRVPVTPGLSKFRIGSVIKSMTADAVAQLFEQGKLDLDAPIQTYVPDFPEKQAPISLRQLLGHLAGVRHYEGEEFMNHQHYETVTDGLAIFADDPLVAAPGEAFHYSSYGFNLISAAIETASGEDYLSYMNDHIFKPAGMKSTVPDLLFEIIPGRGRYYGIRDDQIWNMPEVDNSYKWASGGFVGTSDDLVRYGMAQLSNSLVSTDARRIFWTEQETSSGDSTGYALGWRVSTDDKGQLWVGHGGGSVGGSTQFYIMPESGLVIAMISNLSGFDYGDVLIKLAEIFLRDAQIVSEE